MNATGMIAGIRLVGQRLSRVFKKEKQIARTTTSWNYQFIHITQDQDARWTPDEESRTSTGERAMVGWRLFAKR